MISIFLMWSFKPIFLLSSFTLIMRGFSISLLPAIRVVSSAYLSLLVFLLAILVPACDLSSTANCSLLLKPNKKGDAEAETPILWPSDAKNRLIGKDPVAGKD